MTRGIVPLVRLDGSTDEMPDEALIAACGKGASAALGALFDRHATSIRRFLARLSGTDDRDLDDLVQATFESVARSAVNFDGRSSARTWLFGIANNVVRHHVRGELRRKRLSDAATVEPPCARSDDPSANLADRERADQLRKGLAMLSPALREVFVLVYLEGMSGPEVSQVLGIRTGAIWKRLHEARTKLRAYLEVGMTP